MSTEKIIPASKRLNYDNLIPYMPDPPFPSSYFHVALIGSRYLFTSYAVENELPTGCQIKQANLANYFFNNHEFQKFVDKCIFDEMSHWFKFDKDSYPSFAQITIENISKHYFLDICIPRQSRESWKTFFVYCSLSAEWDCQFHQLVFCFDREVVDCVAICGVFEVLNADDHSISAEDFLSFTGGYKSQQKTFNGSGLLKHFL